MSDPMDPSGGGLSGSLTPPHSTFTPFPAPPRKKKKGLASPAHVAAGTGPHPRVTGQSARQVAAARARASKPAPHSAHATAHHKLYFPPELGYRPVRVNVSQPGDMPFAVVGPPMFLYYMLGEGVDLFGNHPGIGPGAGPNHATALGHHPQADGTSQFPTGIHSGIARRGTIITHDPLSGTAVVRLGDTPDSPTSTIPYAQNISAAQVAASQAAIIVFGNTGYADDAIVAAVL
jgi:hypothetical protein